MRSEKRRRRRSGKRRGEEKKEKKKKRGKEPSPVESDPSKNRTRFQLYLPFFIDRNIYPRLREHRIRRWKILLGRYILTDSKHYFAQSSRDLFTERSFAETFSPGENRGWENGKALVRFGRVRWAKRGNCHRGLRENRGLPTLVEYTRVSKRSGSSLTKEVGRDARRTARDRWWGKESLQLVPSFVARWNSMKLATCIAVKFVNTVPFARLSR